jgi:hypothetical protein
MDITREIVLKAIISGQGRIPDIIDSVSTSLRTVGDKRSPRHITRLVYKHINTLKDSGIITQTIRHISYWYELSDPSTIVNHRFS